MRKPTFWATLIFALLLILANLAGAQPPVPTQPAPSLTVHVDDENGKPLNSEIYPYANLTVYRVDQASATLSYIGSTDCYSTPNVACFDPTGATTIATDYNGNLIAAGSYTILVQAANHRPQ